MKLSPPLEEEEDFATRVVVEQEEEHEQQPAVVTRTVLLGEEEYSSLARALGNKDAAGGTYDGEEMDVEISDDESKVGDDGDSAVGGIKRRRTVRVVIRSRAFL
jgi:hypothetical protein